MRKLAMRWAMSLLRGRLAPQVRSCYHVSYRALVRCRWQLAEIYDRIARPCAEARRLPPAHLRFRVGESPSRRTFLLTGQRTCHNLTAALEAAGRPLSSFQSILDFGCGCGRTLLWLGPQAQASRLWGTDVDEEAIRWCREHFPFAEFATNEPLPPLAYPSGSFDLVYAISVFTHFNKRFQRLWLDELKRVLRPGGVLLLTVHGQRAWERLGHDLAGQIRGQGTLHLLSGKLRGICPSWYGTTFHTEDYVVRHFGRTFKLLAYLSAGMGDQDAVILGRAARVRDSVGRKRTPPVPAG